MMMIIIIVIKTLRIDLKIAQHCTTLHNIDDDDDCYQEIFELVDWWIAALGCPSGMTESTVFIVYYDRQQLPTYL